MIAYLVTSLATGGITRNALSQRWRRHVSDARRDFRNGPLQRAIKKYGSGSFKIKHIASARNWSDLCATEVELVKEHQTRAPHGYNLTDGGEGIVGYIYAPELVARIAAKNRGRKHTPEAIALIAAASRGCKFLPSHGAAISAARKGKPLSPEHCKKLSLAKIGRKRPPRTKEHCARISEGLRRAHARRRVQANVQ